MADIRRRVATSAGALRLIQLLNRLFAQQAREAAIRVRLDSGDVPDMTAWIGALANACRSTILQAFVAGADRTRRRIAEIAPAVAAPIDRMEGRRYVISGPEAFAAEGALLAERFPMFPRYVLSRSTRREVRKGDPGLSVYTGWSGKVEPRVLDAVDAAVLVFCRETMATATGDLRTVLDRLRKLMREGLSRGDATQVLAIRIREIFADPMRAFRIATTEPRRAVHSGQLMVARESGIVKKKVWLASSDACKDCLALDGKAVLLDEPFVILPKRGPYAIVQAPPLHPSCFCDMTEEI